MSIRIPNVIKKNVVLVVYDVGFEWQLVGIYQALVRLMKTCWRQCYSATSICLRCYQLWIGIKQYGHYIAEFSCNINKFTLVATQSCLSIWRPVDMWHCRYVLLRINIANDVVYVWRLQTSFSPVTADRVNYHVQFHCDRLEQRCFLTDCRLLYVVLSMCYFVTVVTSCNISTCSFIDNHSVVRGLFALTYLLT